jgi:hypothetical protein
MRSGREEVVPAPRTDPERAEVQHHAHGEEPPVGDGQAGRDLVQVDVPEDIDQQRAADRDADEDLRQPPPRGHGELGSEPARGAAHREPGDHASVSTRIMVGARTRPPPVVRRPASAARMSPFAARSWVLSSRPVQLRRAHVASGSTETKRDVVGAEDTGHPGPRTAGPIHRHPNAEDSRRSGSRPIMGRSVSGVPLPEGKIDVQRRQKAVGNPAGDVEGCPTTRRTRGQLSGAAAVETSGCPTLSPVMNTALNTPETAAIGEPAGIMVGCTRASSAAVRRPSRWRAA